jgi:DNA-binding transcriptional ArsR family regulator
MEEEGFDKAFKSVANFFDVLSHPDRLKTLSVLHKKEMDVNELQQALGISQSRVSQHLKLLKLYSLVFERRDGRHVYYSLKDQRISKVVESAVQFQMMGIAAEPELITMFNEIITMWHI